MRKQSQYQTNTAASEICKRTAACRLEQKKTIGFFQQNEFVHSMYYVHMAHALYSKRNTKHFHYETIVKIGPSVQ